MIISKCRRVAVVSTLMLINLASRRKIILAFTPTASRQQYATLPPPYFRTTHHQNSHHPKKSQLRNVPLEDVLEAELFEMETELAHVSGPAKDDADKNKQAQQEQPKQIKATDAASIIAGTAIGGGFLALPSVTAPIGYLPAAVGLIAAWSFLLLSATAFIESAGLVADIKEQETSSSNDEITAVDEGAISVATVIRYAFGKKCALIGGTLFIAQMLAVVTAQVVKGAELFSDCFSFIPYLAGCLVPTTLAGLFAFRSRPEVVERANTALTTMMVGGFIALVIGTITSGNVGKAAGALFSRADYSKLLPTGGDWALPVFINMLCFGQAMPLVVERMVQGSKSSTSAGKTNTSGDSSKEAVDVNGSSRTGTRASSLFRARSAATLGASAPIILSLTWAAISTALVSPTATNPIQSLLSMGPEISIPVGLLATGAIGTTLLGSFLAMGHFVADIVCMKLGYCSFTWMNVCNAITVAIPSVLACVGPSIYLPLLAFSGAYPTTILHGLSPALAALVLRRRAKRVGVKDGSIGATPRLVPGGEITLVGLTAAALGLIGASTYLAARQMVRVVGA